jgi:hypothetical protein
MEANATEVERAMWRTAQGKLMRLARWRRGVIEITLKRG